MRHLIRLDEEWNRDRLSQFFDLANQCDRGAAPQLNGGAVQFFPASSLRTRVSFEMGAAQLGLDTVTLPPESLNKPEALEDVVGYLSQWADLLVVRHPDITVLEGLAAPNALPVINAMTNVNHPCEVLSDLYSISRTRDPLPLRYAFIGADGNIARAWHEAARAFGLDLVQCCPSDIATSGGTCTDDLYEALHNADVVITDSPGQHAEALRPFQVTADALAHAAKGVQLIPCPPFIRGREVSADAIASPAFAGYAFKQALLPAQQAIMTLALAEW